MYRHTELEHRHIHGYEDECHYGSDTEDEYRLEDVVHLPDPELQLGCRTVSLVLEHAVQGGSLFPDPHEDGEPLPVQVLPCRHTISQSPSLLYRLADMPDRLAEGIERHDSGHHAESLQDRDP